MKNSDKNTVELTDNRVRAISKQGGSLITTLPKIQLESLLTTKITGLGIQWTVTVDEDGKVKILGTLLDSKIGVLYTTKEE